MMVDRAWPDPAVSTPSSVKSESSRAALGDNTFRSSSFWPDGPSPFGEFWGSINLNLAGPEK
jgi:hypothetical protein